MFPLMAITNLDQVKTLHLAKGEVVGFARPESTNVTYIATTNELNIEETVNIVPRNWVPQWKWNLMSQALRQPQATHSECSESSQKSRLHSEVTEVRICDTPKKYTALTFQESTCKFKEDSQNRGHRTQLWKRILHNTPVTAPWGNVNSENIHGNQWTSSGVR